MVNGTCINDLAGIELLCSNLSGHMAQCIYRRTFTAIIVCSVVPTLICMAYVNWADMLLWYYDDANVDPAILELPNTTKLILTWSTWFGKKNFFDLHILGTAPFKSKHCAHTNCFLTSSKSAVARADVVLFHHKDCTIWHAPWPRRRYPHQYYAHFTHEPSGNRKPGAITHLDRYEGRINVSINYRRDADLYVPYTLMLKRSTVNPPYKPRIPLAMKTKMALWPVSNCYANSARNDYVAELQRHLPVDIYGRCGDHTCSRSRTDSCMREWEASYKFYISFENNICDDYITEKLFLPLRYANIFANI